MADDTVDDLTLTRAALLGAFDPLALLGLEAADASPGLRALAAAATEVRVRKRWLWTLTPDARREGLSGLSRVKGAKARAALFDGLPVRPDDALAQAFRVVLGVDRVPPEIARLRKVVPKGKDLPALLHLLQAVDLLRGAGVALTGWAADPDISHRLSRITVQAGKAAESEQILPGKFHGRRRELAALLAFARTLEVRSPPFVPPPAPPPDAQPPLPGAAPSVILSGLGGTGKSALLEAVRRRLGKDASILLVTLDLDKPALRAGNRVALTTELLRQIGEARPALDARLSALRNTLRGAMGMTTEGIDPSRVASAVLACLSDLNTILSEAGKDDPIRLVLVFDTFEEALNLGTDQVKLIADWISLVGANRLSPRIILSGREAAVLAKSPLPGLAVQGSILLDELGAKAGQALLRDRFRAAELDAEDLVPQLVATFGSDPLTLMTLARFAASIDRRGSKLRRDLVALASDEGSEIRQKLDAEMRQTFLVSRILKRLPPEIQALASPGLVLRQVTPRLILEVMAGPCGLPETLTLAEAEDLFDRLADVGSLVRKGAGGAKVAEHVPDLRRRMLPQVLPDPKAREVALAAADWYLARAGEGDPKAELEAIYYRALAEPDSLPKDPEVLRALADHLGPAMADLRFARDLFRDAQGKVISREAVEALQDAGVQKTARARRRKFQLSEGLENAVVEEAAGASFDPDAPMPTDLVAAYFAALDLEPVAAEAPRLMRDLLRGLSATVSGPDPTGTLTSDDLQGLSVATLQAATACRSPDLGPEPAVALRDAVRDWLADPSRREALVASYAGALQQSPQLWPAKLVAALVLALADADSLVGLGAPVALAMRGMARSSHSPYAWRALRLVGPLQEDAEIKGIALAYLAPEVLVFLSVNVTQSETQDVAAMFKALVTADKPVSISDHNTIDAVLYREDISLRDKLALLQKIPTTMPGRMPEFHGAFRQILGNPELAPANVQEAVRMLARFVRWWPKELGPEAFAEAPFGPTLISSLIDTADRCGRLPDLAAALAGQKQAPEACRRLAGLVASTVDYYRASVQDYLES